MGINLFVVIAAFAVGIGTALVMIRVLERRDDERSALLQGLTVATVLTLVGLGYVVLAFEADSFALVHLLYVVVTVGAPLAAVIVVFLAPPMERWLRALLVVVMALAPIGFYATHIEPFWLQVDRVTVPVSVAGVDLRVGVLSDLQTESIGTYEEGAVTALLAENPDLVLIPGDVWQMPDEDFLKQSPAFTALISRICDEVDNVFVVKGNTDDLAGLRRIVSGTDAVVLDNEVADFTVDGVAVRVLGITLGGAEERLSEARSALLAPTPSADPIRIVLAHHPDEVYGFAPRDAVDLVVSGHTHGGQIAVPLFGPPVTMSSVPRAVAAGGLHEVGGHVIYVSTGVGRERAHAPQVRLGVRPSIGVLDLTTAGG